MDNNSCCAKPTSCSTEAPKDKGGCGPGSCGTGGGKGGKCCATMIKGALLGGIVMFIWLSVSWMFIPWHMNTMAGFKDQAAVAKTLTDNAPESGIYMLPFMDKTGAQPEVTAPFAFVSIFTPGGEASDMTPQLVKQLVACIIAAAVLTCLLKMVCCGGCPVLGSFKVGLLAALMVDLPNWIWFHFPLDYTLVNAADHVIAFTLAGLVISKLALSKKSCGTGGGCGTPTSGETKTGCCG